MTERYRGRVIRIRGKDPQWLVDKIRDEEIARTLEEIPGKCPFCGKDPVLQNVRRNDNRVLVAVVCIRCDIGTPWMPNRKRAISKWNLRIRQPELWFPRASGVCSTTMPP